MSKAADDSVGLVFMHGAGLGEWIWKGLVPLLEYPYLLADFPARDDEEARKGLGLEDYTSHVLQQIEAWPVQGIVIVAHSLSGGVALKVADRLGDRLAGFVGLSAGIPKGGGSYVSTLPMPARVVVPLIMRLAGTKPPEKAIRNSLCAGLGPEQTNEIVKRFAAEPIEIYTARTNAPIPTAPRMYIRSLRDKDFSKAMQTSIQNLGPDSVHDIDFGHMTMLGKPYEVATLLNTFVGGLKH